MLYFKALRQGLSDLPQADPALRAALEAEGRERGWPALHGELARLDPVTAARLHPTDPQRIQRALEIIRLTGRPMSALLAEQRPAPLPYRLLPLALAPTDRAVLHQRIADRFQTMLAAGFMEEMARLRAKYRLHGDLPAMRCVGYRQAWEVLEGLAPAAELADRGIFATRQLAKRQITWLRADPTAEVFDCLAPDLSAQVAARVRAFLQA